MNRKASRQSTTAAQRDGGPRKSRRWLVGVAGLLAAAAALWGLSALTGDGQRQQTLHGETPAATDAQPPAAAVDPPSVADDIDPEVYAAIQSARQAISAEPTSGQAWGELGMVLAAHEFNTEANLCFKRAALLDPKQAKWPYLHARGLMLSQPNEAVPLLERAVELCGNEPAAPRLTLAELYLELYQLDDAERHLLEYEVANSANPRGRLAKARLALMRDDYDSCLKQLDELRSYLEQIPGLRGRAQPVYQMMSEVYRRMGRLDEAEAARRQALAESTPSWPDAYRSEVQDKRAGLKRYLVDADKLFGRKQYEQSIAILRRAIESYPDTVWARILLGRALIRTGAPGSQRPDRERRLAEAEEVLAEAIELEPSSVEALFRLAVAKGYRGDLPAAAELYLRAIEIKPDFTMAYYNLAHCRRQMLDPEGAIEALRGVIRCEPDQVNGRIQLGELLIQAGQFEEALKHLEIAEQLTPGSRLVRQLRSRAESQSADR